MTSFKTLKQISRKCTSTTSVEPPWNSTNNSVVHFPPFFNNGYYYSIWAIKTGFRTKFLHMARLTGERELDPVPITTCLIMSLFISLIPFFLSFFFLSFLPFLFFFLFFFLSTLHPPTLFGWGPTRKQVVRPNHLLKHPLDAPALTDHMASVPSL